MPDAEDAKIMRLVVRVVAAAIFCLLCGGIAGIFIVGDEIGAGPGGQRVQLSPGENRPG